MRIEPGLLAMLRCPVSGSPLRPLSGAEANVWNARIARGGAGHPSGSPVREPLADGLIAASGSCVYPVRDGVPFLVPLLRIVEWDPSGPPAGPATAADPWGDRWEELARRWNDLGPPIRPVPEDAGLLLRHVAAARAATGRPECAALLLGVTPEIATMPWPAGTQMLALDSSEAMIRHVWPADRVPDGVAALADWLAMPVRDGSCDVVVGDGSLSVPRYPADVATLVREVRRVLRDDGALAVRMFTRPETPETVDAVFADLRAGRIATLDAFKWRLVMALHGDVATGARMGDIWDAWEARVPDPGGLMRSLGWPEDAPDILRGLRGLEARVTFPTLSEVRAVLAPEFEEEACLNPGYADGERYPTMLFRPARRRARRS